MNIIPFKRKKLKVLGEEGMILINRETDGRVKKMKLNFDDVYKIMKQSFPLEEIRSYEGQRALLDREDYFIKTYIHNGDMAGFCAYYELNDFLYIEHLACSPEVRGLGIGTKLVQEVLDEAGERVVILEVEPPVDEMTKRRVAFYEKLDFYLNPYYHFQPPLNKDTDGVELKIMSSARSLTAEEQEAYRRVLNTYIYHVQEDLYI